MHSTKEIIYMCEENGFDLVKRDSIFFIPIRIYLTMIHISKSYRLNKFLFEFGEFILKIPFVRDAFSDYKILLFKKVI